MDPSVQWSVDQVRRGSMDEASVFLGHPLFIQSNLMENLNSEKKIQEGNLSLPIKFYHTINTVYAVYFVLDF